jgi:ribosome-binding protein aMBF1 (putative translation factor)
MRSKKPRRLTRSRKLTAKEAARDRDLRRRVAEEFPPAPRPPIPDSLSDALKSAVAASGLTVYEIAKRAKVSQIIISRFLSGERDIRMATADKLAQVLGLKLTGARS